jgi:hypothetical protein
MAPFLSSSERVSVGINQVSASVPSLIRTAQSCHNALFFSNTRWWATVQNLINLQISL